MFPITQLWHRPPIKKVAGNTVSYFQVFTTTFFNTLMLGSSSCPETDTKSKPEEKMGLNTLPYDLLLNIATRLELRDVHALHLVSLFFALEGDTGRNVDCNRARPCDRDLPFGRVLDGLKAGARTGMGCLATRTGVFSSPIANLFIIDMQKSLRLFHHTTCVPQVRG